MATTIVSGIECRPVAVPLTFPSGDAAGAPVMGGAGFVTVLEATAKAQDALVSLALLEEESTGGGGGGSSSKGEESGSIDDSPIIGTRQGDIYGSVLWPAASCVASYLLEYNVVRGKSVLELGTGTGLVSLASWCLGGANSVVATDYEDLPLRLLDHAARHLNQPPTREANSEDGGGGAPVGLRTGLFDVRNFTDPLPEGDVVVAADILYEPVTGRALAQRVVQALRRGSRVVIGDSPGRAGRPAFLEELERCGVAHAAFLDVRGWTVTGERHELICGKGSTSRTSTIQELAIAVLDLDPSSITSPHRGPDNHFVANSFTASMFSRCC
jgi:predicted nicotinamide N-methyase